MSADVHSAFYHWPIQTPKTLFIAERNKAFFEIFFNSYHKP